MKTYSTKKFGGINEANSLNELKAEEATELLNIRLSDNMKLKRRPGTAQIGTLGPGKIRSMKEIRDNLLIAQNDRILKLYGDTWIESGLSGLNTSAIPKFIEFPATDGINVTTGTVSSVGNNGYVITDNNAVYTDNELVDKFIKITSGVGSYQIRLITANTQKEIFVSEPFIEFPNGNYAIQSKIDGNYFFNGVDQPKKNLDINTTTWINIPNIPYFKGICEYKNRLIGFTYGSNEIHISTLLNGEDYPYKIQTGNNYPITSIRSFGNQLVINKGMKGGIFITEFDDPTQAIMIQRADNYGGINDESVDIGENLFFFASERGIEWFNPLETNMLEGHKSLSSYRIPELSDTDIDKSNAQGICFDAKYFCSINNKVYIFDIGVYLQLLQDGKSKPYTFLIDEGYEVECFEVYDGELYIGGNGKVVKMSNDYSDDEGTPFDSYWEKDNIDPDEGEKMKLLRLVQVLSSGNNQQNILKITISTDKETKTLDDIVLDKSYKKSTCKRIKGYKFKMKLDIAEIGDSSIERVNRIYEVGKI